jgi:DNA-binding MurR/RpiR family transcriptional regulator
MNIYERIKKGNLPLKQHRVLERVLHDLEASSFLTGQEICEKYDISFSSLTRMAKTLGYSGFPELKKEIGKLYRDEYSPSRQAQNFIDDTKDHSILKLVLASEIKNIKKLTNTINEKDIMDCAKIINNTKRVFIIGIGQLNIITQKISNSLNLLGHNTICYTELGFSLLSEIHAINKDDIVIGISVNKELVELKEFFITMSEKKVTTILFTDKKTGRLRNYSDISFYTPSNGHGVINNLTPLLVLTNILESIMFSLDKHVHLSKIKKIEKGWNSLPIFL